MKKNLCRALAPVLLFSFATSPAFATHFPTGSRYMQLAASRPAPSGVSDNKRKCDSKSTKQVREASFAWPAWHELLSLMF